MALTSIVSGGPTQPNRTFAYDGRGFLTNESHPETASIVSHQLDALGNPGRRTQGALSGLQFAYDKAARPTRVTSEEQGGRELAVLTFAAPGSSTSTNLRAGQVTKIESFNYFDDRPDPAAGGALKDYRGIVTEDLEYGEVEGRVSKRTTTVEGQWNAVNQTTWAGLPRVLEARFDQTVDFDAVGNLTAESYPQCVNSTLCGSPAAYSTFYSYKYGQVTKVLGGVDLANATALATAAIYHPNGLMNTMIHSVPTTQPMRFVQTIATGLSRPSNITVRRGAGGAVQWSQEYLYDGSGNPKQIGADLFRYDLLSRIERSTMDGQTAAQTYTFDAFGNLTQNATSKTTTLSVPASTSTNRMTGAGVVYDDAGNLKTAPGGLMTYTWNRLNQLQTYAPSATSKWNFLYTGGGERLRVTDGAWSAGAWTLRSLDGRVLREYTKSGTTWSARDTIWGPRGILATNGSEGTRHIDVDHLGTPRLIYDTSGNLKDENNATVTVPRKPLLPFGTELKDPLTAMAHNATERHLFTGHERDNAATGTRSDDVDDMHFRFFAPNWGRFLSADPVLGSLESPQSWNRYAYVLGGPMKYVDPLGLNECIRFDDGTVINCGFTDESTYGFGGPGGLTGIFGNPADDPLRWSRTGGPPQFAGRRPFADFNPKPTECIPIELMIADFLDGFDGLGANGSIGSILGVSGQILQEGTASGGTGVVQGVSWIAGLHGQWGGITPGELSTGFGLNLGAHGFAVSINTALGLDGSRSVELFGGIGSGASFKYKPAEATQLTFGGSGRFRGPATKKPRSGPCY